MQAICSAAPVEVPRDALRKRLMLTLARFLLNTTDMIFPEAAKSKGTAKSHKRALLALLTLGVLLGVGLCGFAYIKSAEKVSCPLNVAICVHLNVNGQPTIGNSVLLKAEVVSHQIPSPNTKLTISLPPQVELVEGNLEWQGDLPPDEKLEHTLLVKVTQPGEWKISAYAGSAQDAHNSYGSGDVLYNQWC